MTHDEAYSFYNVKHFWWVETLCTGNTHWFNFGAIKLAVLLGLEKIGYLRWFTSLSVIVFLAVSYQWLKTLPSFYVKGIAFCLLLLNPYMIDYFSLARGYAAGMTFQALSLLFLYRALNEEKRVNTLFAIGFAGLSAIANFNFYYFFVAFSLAYFFRFYFLNGLSFFKKTAFYLDSIYFIGISALVMKALWFITVCSNDIGPYGGDSFVDSLFSGYVKGWIYGHFQISELGLEIASYSAMLLIFSACLYGVFLHKKHHNQLYLLVSAIVICMYVLCIINRNVFKVLYPVDRTTLMFFPLMALVVVYFIQELMKLSKFVSITLVLVIVMMFVNFILSLNFETTYDYQQQRDAKESFDFVEDLQAKNVGISGDLYGVFRNYYQMTDHEGYSFQGQQMHTNRPLKIGKDELNLEKFDYLIVYPPYHLSHDDHSRVQFTAVKFFPKTQTLILKVEKKEAFGNLP